MAQMGTSKGKAFSIVLLMDWTVFFFSQWVFIEYQLHAKQFTWAPGEYREESHLDLALRLLHFNRGDRATKTKSPDSKYKVVGAVRVRERNLEHIRLLRDVALKLNLNRWCKFGHIRRGKGHLGKKWLIVGCVRGTRNNTVSVDYGICKEEGWKVRPETSVEARWKKVVNSRLKNVWVYSAGNRELWNLNLVSIDLSIWRFFSSWLGTWSELTSRVFHCSI